MEKYFFDILESAFFNLIIIGAALSLLYGLWLIISPNNALLLNHKINKSFSLREKTKPLETPISVERIFYRYAKVTGSFLTLGALYLFYVLLWELDIAYSAQNLPGLTVLTWEWLLQAFQIFFLIASVAIFIIGLLILFRPSLLKPLEEKANTWISTRRKMQFMTDEMGQADKLLDLFPRQFGAIILICATIVLLNVDKFNI